MAVTRLEIKSRSPYADGIAFGDAGPYERIDGLFHYAVDPEHPVNSAITDLHLAPRNDAGLVEFTGDVTLFLPQDRSKSSGRALLEDPNRGRTGFHKNFNRSRGGGDSDGSSSDIDPGDGFLFENGFTVAVVGWQWDVIRRGSMMAFDAPYAEIDGKPITGQTCVEIFPSVVRRSWTLANRTHKPVPVADISEQNAQVTVREWEDGPDTVIPRNEWRFARETDDGEIVDSAEHIYLNDGFKPGLIYRVVYTTVGAPVVGAGLLALRDAASCLRYGGTGDEIGGHVERVYGWGRSQTGRLWRHFTWLGLNLDEQERQAFNGLLPLVAGGRRGEFNHRFAQPSTQTNPNFGHLFPFHAEALTDPYTGERVGLLRRHREIDGLPKIMFINTAAEYWRGDGSLTHTDPAGESDIPDAPETRNYLFASTQHMIGTIPLFDCVPGDTHRGQHPFNCIDYTPFLRAALMNMDRWCAEGVEPPASAYPRISDGTAVQRSRVLDQFRSIPGISIPNPDRLPILRRVDLGRRVDEGIGSYPVTEHETYHCYASAVDDDGNEIGGLRPPEVAVPVATYTGWNPRHPDIGASDQILNMQGITHFFPRTRQEREANGDPRLSIEERYADRNAYKQQARAYVRDLVAQGYVLEGDVENAVGDAVARYDLAVGE